MKSYRFIALVLVLAAVLGSVVGAEETEVQLRAKIARLEIEMTIGALEKGAAAVSHCFKTLEAQSKSFAKDAEVMKSVSSNLRWCALAQLEIEQEIDRQKKRLKDIKVPAPDTNGVRAP